MSNIDKLTIDQHWDRLVPLARKLGGTSTEDWTLVEGEEIEIEGERSKGRVPWRVMDGERVVMTLGYTRREVVATLLHMNTILAACLGG